MRRKEISNPGLTEFINSEVLPVALERLAKFNKDLDLLNFPSREYIVFGSVARGNPQEGSDLDIGVVVDSYKGQVSLGDFCSLLDEGGVLCRVHNVPIELMLFEREIYSILGPQGYRKIDIPRTRDGSG